MGKEKVVEEITKSTVSATNNMTSMIVQYAPLIVGLICLVVCYLLYKKIQTLNSQGDGISKMEKQFTNFVKEQSEVNAVNSKKFNSVISQVNQLSYIIQNINVRETNSMDSQMSPEREIIQGPSGPSGPSVQQVAQAQQEVPVKQSQQREMMPTSVIQTNFPIQQENELPVPIITSNKKEIDKKDNLKVLQQQQVQEQNKKSSKKKVIDLQKLKEEEVLIEEDLSSDED